MKFLMFLIVALTIHSISAPRAQAAFEEGYLSPQDILLSLNKKFDTLAIDAYECQVIGSEHRKALGDINPLTGEVSVALPDTSFLTWYSNCLTSYTNFISLTYSESQNKQKAVISNLLSKIFRPLENRIAQKGGPDGKIEEVLKQIYFYELSPEEKAAYVDNIVAWALGNDEEILSYGLIQDMDAFRDDILAYANKMEYRSVMDIGTTLIKILLKRDEFLLY